MGTYLTQFYTVSTAQAAVGVVTWIPILHYWPFVRGFPIHGKTFGHTVEWPGKWNTLRSYDVNRMLKVQL